LPVRPSTASVEPPVTKDGHDEPRGLARLALMHLEAMSRWGVPRAEILREAGLDAAQLADPDARIPLASLVRLWRAAAARVADPLFGLHLGAGTRARDWGLVGYTMAFSATLRSALNRLARYGRIVSDALVVQLASGDDATWVRLDVQPALRSLRPAADFRLAALLAVCREITGMPIAPRVVQLPYRRPPDVREYQRLFRGRLQFGALTTALLLAEDDLARPIAAADPSLAGYLDRLAEQAVTDLGEARTIRMRVRRALWSQLSEGVPALDRIARSLGMSERTLQRRLREEGTTFAAVLAELRHDLAEPLLRDGRLAVSEVAFLLGYEDAGSLHRVFRRRAGLTPRAYRRKLG
jgi:AraC-like DNA-binding protein